MRAHSTLPSQLLKPSTGRHAELHSQLVSPVNHVNIQLPTVCVPSATSRLGSAALPCVICVVSAGASAPELAFAAIEKAPPGAARKNVHSLRARSRRTPRADPCTSTELSGLPSMTDGSVPVSTRYGPGAATVAPELNPNFSSGNGPAHADGSTPGVSTPPAPALAPPVLTPPIAVAPAAFAAPPPAGAFPLAPFALPPAAAPPDPCVF